MPTDRLGEFSDRVARIDLDGDVVRATDRSIADPEHELHGSTVRDVIAQVSGDDSPSARRRRFATGPSSPSFAAPDRVYGRTMIQNPSSPRTHARSLGWFGAGVAATLTLTGVIVGVRVTAAPSPAETTFVPITPCRLADTRPEPDNNVGPRDTPLGPDQIYTLQVTGTNGNCTIPTDATGIALNVTAVAPTAAGYFTIYPSDAPTRPLVSNLNFVAGSPPTPNKVDVKLSADGKISVYNLAGNAHLVADVGGYYTHQGIQDLIDAQTITKNVSYPALALNLFEGDTVIVPGSFGLDWANSGGSSAFVAMHRPDDWTAAGNVVVRMLFERTNAAAGNVQFFVRPRDYDPNDPFLDKFGTLSTIQSAANTNFQEVSMTIPASELQKAWWHLVIQRNVSVASPYPNSVTLHSVDIEYQAHT